MAVYAIVVDPLARAPTISTQSDTSPQTAFHKGDTRSNDNGPCVTMPNRIRHSQIRYLGNQILRIKQARFIVVSRISRISARKLRNIAPHTPRHVGDTLRAQSATAFLVGCDHKGR